MKKLIYATSTRFPRAVRKPPRTTSCGVSLGPLFPQESRALRFNQPHGKLFSGLASLCGVFG